MTEPTSNPPANWYPDPKNESELRYWDGMQWTEHVHPPVSAQAQPAQQQTQSATNPYAPNSYGQQAAVTPAGLGQSVQPLQPGQGIAQQMPYGQTSAAKPASLLAADPAGGFARPITLTAGAAVWAVAGLLAIITPFISLGMLNNQTYRVSSYVLGSSIGFVIVGALINAALYVWICYCTFLGQNVPRIFGTIFSGLSIISAIMASTAASLPFMGYVAGVGFSTASSWIQVVLHIVGVVLVWMAASNEYVRYRQQQKLNARAAMGRF